MLSKESSDHLMGLYPPLVLLVATLSPPWHDILSVVVIVSFVLVCLTQAFNTLVAFIRKQDENVQDKQSLAKRGTSRRSGRQVCHVQRLQYRHR